MKEQLERWLKEISRWGRNDYFMQLMGETSSPDEYLIMINFYTRDNLYRITAKDNKKEDRTYLGCTVSRRKPRAGEDWTRGSDLPDGAFTQETWDKIKNSIISYELVKIIKPVRSKTDDENII
jgi:hypothetical protein